MKTFKLAQWSEVCSESKMSEDLKEHLLSMYEEDFVTTESLQAECEIITDIIEDCKDDVEYCEHMEALKKELIDVILPFLQENGVEIIIFENIP